MNGGGIRYGRSYGAESVENAGFARSKRGSNEMIGTQKEKCANGSRTPPISERGDPEQPMGKESRPGT